MLALCATPPSLAQLLAAHAKENKCADAPQVLPGTTMYKCNTPSGPAFFNVPENTGSERPARRAGSNSHNSGNAGAAASTPPATVVTPGLPRVDSATQKSRDDLRRRVLQEELAAEEKLLAETRTAYANGAPPPLPEEKAQPQRYSERIARLREAVLRHEKNIEMLRKELGAPR
jgi:hypothetical protein